MVVEVFDGCLLRQTSLHGKKKIPRKRFDASPSRYSSEKVRVNIFQHGQVADCRDGGADAASLPNRQEVLTDGSTCDRKEDNSGV